MKKRLLASLLSVCLIVGLFPAALAVDETPGDEAPAVCAQLPGCVEGAHDEACPLYAAPEEPEAVPEQEAEPETEPEAVYTLRLTHVFRYKLDGKSVNVQASEVVPLTEADFEDGVCDLNRFVYDAEQLTVTRAGTVRLEDFDENGVHLFGAQIVYAVSSGWRIVRKADAAGEGTVLREVFNGKLGDYEFVPENVVRIKLEYKYSTTGGLAGIDAADPDTVEAIPTEQAGTYKVTWDLPEVDGFRIVLDPSKLNVYVKDPPKGGETPEELAEKLENGNFDVDIDKYTIYYYQQQSSQDHTIQNPAYNNRYSDEYNQAWNAARTLTVNDDDGNKLYTATAVGENTNPGASALTNPQLEVTLTEEQLKSGTDLKITVFYRRNATWYTVNHWVPQTLSGKTEAEINALPSEQKKTEGTETYVRLDQETLQGRVGALTRAKAKTDGVYEQLQSVGFSQKLIENTGTVVDIDYAAAKSYRVIFDTDYTYIPRQQVELGKAVDFTNVAKPKRTGYTFDGWRYLKKGATPNANGEYNDTDYEDAGTKDAPALTVNEALIAAAKLTESGGVLALHLYPKWTPDTTNVRVILWTEDLTGTDDVQAFATGGNVSANGTDYYSQKYRNYSTAPVTHKPDLGQSDPHYSNAGSFTVDVPTDSSLLNAGQDKALLEAIQQQVTTEFKNKMGQASGIDVANFYKQAAFEIVHEEGGKINYNATTASADGKTTIYVYFTRNVYELRFTYYGTADNTSNYSVAHNTNGYSWGGIHDSGNVFDTNGNLNFGYVGQGDSGKTNNYWSTIDGGNLPVPKTITIKAKYGADLRNVWPVARPAEQAGVSRMISWATTRGKYCQDGQWDANNNNSTHPGEPTIMGVYAAMGSEIIAVPNDPSIPHHLVAYWNDNAPSHYRYNHCYEVPELNVTGMRKVSIHNNDTTDERNFLYLVPTDNAAIAQYGFNDLMRVSYNGGTITYNDDDGNYYAVRANTSNRTTKYYAVARQVETVSTNAIEKQNPSARLHMTRVNNNAVHSTEYTDTSGGNGNNAIGTADAPYDLYFYYDRDRYTITYMAPSNDITTANEKTLGTVTLPYGALVTQEKYGFELEYQDKNTNAKYGWTAAAETPVCPDRHENGTAVWKFKGWALGPAGAKMQWTMNKDAETEAQAGDAFAIAGNLRLYAIWDTPTYEVTFHFNGGKDNQNRDTIVENVPANRRYSSTENDIPRPLRSGYTLTGWYVADADGKITSPETAFTFDETITSNMHVAAKWTAVSTETFDYTVYYVTDKPLEADKSKDTVQIDKNGEIVTAGGTIYYVLSKAEHTNQMFIANSPLNLSAVTQTGYVPRETNRILTMGRPDDPYNVIFYYDPIIPGQHVVQFVLAGTENEAQPTSVKTVQVEADQTVVTPQSAAAKALHDSGYELVNRTGDAGAYTYTAVAKAGELKWIDKDGTAKEMTTLTGDANIPDTITYLVQPIKYTITYKNADDAPAAAGDALIAANNPTQYTTRDTFTAKNPERVYENGKLYQFKNWTLGTNTTESDVTDTKQYNPLTVDVGTVGNLTFIANWTEMTDTGSLTVSKTVAGDAGETDKYFNFTVTLDDTAVTGTFGDMAFTNGEATFTLKHGESKTAKGLTAGITYEVTETEADWNGYTTTSTGEKGTIAKDATAEAKFTNTKKSSSGGSSGGSGGGGGSSVLNTDDHYSYIIGYKDGTLRPYGTITRGEVATIFFRLLTDEARDEYWDQDSGYSDCGPDLWCNNAISTLSNMGIIDGFQDGTFRPYAKITRAQFAKIAVGFFETTTRKYQGYYSDVPENAWFTDYVEAASRVGLIQGFEDGTFRPNVNITRAQACVIVNRALNRKPDEDHLLPERKMLTWPDNNPGDWFYADMQEATNSHDYTWLSKGSEKKYMEEWTKKLEQRDWAAFEHAWSTAHSAPGGEVAK